MEGVGRLEGVSWNPYSNPLRHSQALWRGLGLASWVSRVKHFRVVKCQRWIFRKNIHAHLILYLLDHVDDGPEGGGVEALPLLRHDLPALPGARGSYRPYGQPTTSIPGPQSSLDAKGDLSRLSGGSGGAGLRAALPGGQQVRQVSKEKRLAHQLKSN